jgi:D-galacturonate reductase
MMDAAIIGIGEYVTGLSGDAKAKSDKSLGVIALSLFDMKDQGLIENIHLVGRDPNRFDLIKKHFKENLQGTYPSMDTSFIAHPTKQKSDVAYKDAIDGLKKGSAVLVFTPDDTHFDIAKYALQKGMHTLVAKPLVKTSKEHKELACLAKENNCLLMLEVHKRFDPIYADARDNIQAFGDFSYFNSYMSQPKSQLDTFASWAGISSDISYYLNSHHVDFLCWAVKDFAKPVSVLASSSTGVASSKLNRDVEDTITLTVHWENQSGNKGVSIHTASWIAPPSDVHSQQRFFYMGQKAEINIDQAHRGYTQSIDGSGFKSSNPLFMKYTPRDGKFAGQEAYGYKSIFKFIEAVQMLNKDLQYLDTCNEVLPTIQNTLNVTKILEAGRISLDENRVVNL